MRRCFRY